MNDESLADAPPVVSTPADSIVDTVLDLDEALSGDVRRAERTARFCIKPWLQADIDRLEAELADLVDDRGNPLEKVGDAPLGSPDRDVTTVMAEYRVVHAEFVAAMRTVRVQAMAPSTWEAFKTKWRKQINAEEMSAEMCKELVVGCAFKPAISVDVYANLLDRYGDAALTGVGRTAWAACDHTGVDVPKSSVFSAVQRQLELSKS